MQPYCVLRLPIELTNEKCVKLVVTILFFAAFTAFAVIDVVLPVANVPLMCQPILFRRAQSQIGASPADLFNSSKDCEN